MRLLVGQGHLTHSQASSAFGYGWNTKKLPAPVRMAPEKQPERGADNLEELRARTRAKLAEVAA